MSNLITLILKKDTATKAMKKCSEFGIPGGIVVYGEGSSRNPILKFLEVDKLKKEVLISIAEDDQIDQLENYFKDKFKGPNTAIGFCTQLANVYGVKTERCEKKEQGGKMEAIYVIVDRGKADDVIEIAQQEGAGGATILHGRGAGMKEEGLFHLTIEPEKEIVLMLVAKEKIDAIIQKIYDKLGLAQPNSGIIFTLPVDRTIGISKY